MSTFSSAEVREDFTVMRGLQMSPPALVEAAQDLLLQGLRLLFELGDQTLSRSAGAPFHASIGQHYRHVLEHFQSLIKGRLSAEVNYDARERNVRIETEVTYASIATCDVLRALKNCTEETLARPCKVINSMGYGKSNPSLFESNLNRELAYCIGHAIHHYAIIRLICHEVGITVPPEFGVAPSTLRHLSSVATD
jgi:hypothetical protein